jgi:hypothetical protein
MVIEIIIIIKQINHNSIPLIPKGDMLKYEAAQYANRLIIRKEIRFCIVDCH